MEYMETSAIQNLKKLGSPGGELYQLGYEYIKPLGQGGSGTVGLYRVIRQPLQGSSKSKDFKAYRVGDELAIKVIDIHERVNKLATRTGKAPQEVRNTILKYLLKEASITGIINREIKTCGAEANYILNYQALTTQIDADSRFFYMVSEPMAEDLSELKPEDLDDKTVMGIICQLIYALACLHSIGVVHGDLKPSNIFLTSDGSLKLGDFGESAYINIRQSMPAELSLITGTTPSYSAPETIKGHRSPATKYDLWALGLMILNMLEYRPILGMKTKFKLGDLKKLQQSEINQIIDHLYLHTDESSDLESKNDGTLILRNLLKKLLRIKPNQRVELNKLSEVLGTEGYSGINSKVMGCPKLTGTQGTARPSLQTQNQITQNQNTQNQITQNQITQNQNTQNQITQNLKKSPNGSSRTQRVSTQSLLTQNDENGISPIIEPNLDQTKKPFWDWVMDSLEMVAELPPKGVQWLKNRLAVTV